MESFAFFIVVSFFEKNKNEKMNSTIFLFEGEKILLFFCITKHSLVFQPIKKKKKNQKKTLSCPPPVVVRLHLRKKII